MEATASGAAEGATDGTGAEGIAGGADDAGSGLADGWSHANARTRVNAATSRMDPEVTRSASHTSESCRGGEAMESTAFGYGTGGLPAPPAGGVRAPRHSFGHIVKAQLTAASNRRVAC